MLRAEDDGSYVALAKRSAALTHLQNASTVYLTYLALDDIEIHPLFYLDRQCEEVRISIDGVRARASQIFRKLWNMFTHGDGDRNERYVETTHEVHEFL